MILAIDRNKQNLELLEKFLGKEGYRVIATSNLEEFEHNLMEQKDIKLVLIDISGLDITIWNYCEKIRLKGIPMLIISPRQSTALQRESFSRGARGVLVKPLVINELLAIIKGLTGE
jgi:DNA-binding response OmpR family regulator